MLYRSMLDPIGNTPLVELPNLSPSPDVRFFAKLEGQNPTGSVKDRIAKYMIEAAERDGKLTPGCTILEPTSGNTGISLAFVAKLKGYKVKVVMPDNVSDGAHAACCAPSAPRSSTPRASRAPTAPSRSRRRSRRPTRAWSCSTSTATRPTRAPTTRPPGPEILRDLPEIDVFVAGLGTGGTLTGTGRYLKEHKPGVKVIAAAPHPGDLVQGLRSLEEGFIPPVLDESLLDGRIVVDSRELVRRRPRS